MSQTLSKTSTVRPAGEDRRRARSRRRFQRRQWRRRWHLWRNLLLLLLAGAVVAGAVHVVYFSSWLAVEQVEVRGESELTSTQVETAAAVSLGGPLATVDLDAVGLRVGSLALVKSVEVTRAWPHTVVVEVVEREPVAAVAVGEELRGLDETGAVLAPLTAGEDPLPRVETAREVSSEALAEAASVVAALPADLAGTIDHVEVETIDQITLELRRGAVVRWGSAEQSEQKAQVLAALLEQPPAAEYDVSVPALPTTRG